MSRCPGCGRCRECGQPTPVAPYPYPWVVPYAPTIWPNVPYPPPQMVPPGTTTFPYQYSSSSTGGGYQ